MKHLFLLMSLSLLALCSSAQYYYPYDDSNYYWDDAPSLIIQRDRVMDGWYVSDIDGKRLSDYYKEIRPYSQGASAALDKVMGWCFINLEGKRFTDYYKSVDDFHEGYALVEDKVMGWTFIDGRGKRLVSDYFAEAYPFHRGVALVRGKVMGWYLMNTAGKRITDYHKTPWDFKPPRPAHRPW